VSISAVSSISVFSSVVSSTQQVGTLASDTDDVSGTQGPAGSFRSLLQSVLRTLNQLGLTAGAPQPAPAGGSSAASVAADSGGAPLAAADVRHALHAFMHSLFQALRQESGGDQGSSAGGTPQSGYANLTSDLQGLLQDLSSAGSNSSSAAVSNLKTAFQNLLQALEGGSSSSSAATQPTLQTFVQDLLQNLSGERSTSPATSTQAVGGIVNTAT